MVRSEIGPILVPIWNTLTPAERKRLMGWDTYSNAIGNLVPETNYAEFDDGTVLCQRHFNDKFPNAWNTMIVNKIPWGDLFKFDLVAHKGTETIEYCTKCKEALRIPNDYNDNEQWTEAWAEVAQLIGMTIAIWILKRGGTGQAGMDSYPANKPYPTFNLFATKASFERELRHQCYSLLGHYHIKIDEKTVKVWVRHLIDRSYEIFEKALL